MKTYIEKTYKELADGEHFWTYYDEDCGYGLVEKVKTSTGWEWADGDSFIVYHAVYRIDPDATVWAEADVWGWGEYLIRICTAILALLIIAFFCYASWKG